MVARDIAAILGDYDVDAIAFDRWRIEIFCKAAQDIGLTLPLKEFGQCFKDMAPAIDRLESLLLNGQLRHGTHPVLTMCAANAVINKDAAGNRKLDKAKATGRIDGMVAMAVGALNGEMAASGGDFEDLLSRLLSM